MSGSSHLFLPPEGLRQFTLLLTGFLFVLLFVEPHIKGTDGRIDITLKVIDSRHPTVVCQAYSAGWPRKGFPVSVSADTDARYQ